MPSTVQDKKGKTKHRRDLEIQRGVRRGGSQRIKSGEHPDHKSLINSVWWGEISEKGQREIGREIREAEINLQLKFSPEEEG